MSDFEFDRSTSSTRKSIPKEKASKPSDAPKEEILQVSNDEPKDSEGKPEYSQDQNNSYLASVNCFSKSSMRFYSPMSTQKTLTSVTA